MTRILLAVVLWSSSGIIIKYSGMPVSVLIFFSCLISSSSLGLFMVLRKQKISLQGIRPFQTLLALGPISLINTFSFYFAYQNTSVANAVLTHYTAPIFVALIAPLFLKERPSVKIAIAVAAATAGLWIMLGASADQFVGLFFAGDHNAVGIMAGLLSGFAYGVLIIILRLLAPSYDPVVMTFFQNTIIALMLLPFIRLPENFASAWWAFAVMGTVHSIAAPVLYFRGMKEVTAYTASILGYLEPVCVIILGMIFLNEAVGISTLAGGLMILFSGYLTLKS
ncbi:MAG TPA: DMT family transporter [Dissulfurispiraceae bacterium]|nr:DMT family transporter [Dissulfurispiraceae bacterium]